MKHTTPSSGPARYRPQAEPDDEMVECPVGLGNCPELPMSGSDGFVRHLLAVHPEDVMTRAVFAALVEVQLLRVDDAAAMVEAER